MAKKKPSGAIGKVKKVPVKTDAASVEERALERVGRAMESIGGFLSRWDAAEKKPDSMVPEVLRIRQFYNLLKGWQEEAMEAKGSRDDKARVRRLREFVAICHMYS